MTAGVVSFLAPPVRLAEWLPPDVPARHRAIVEAALSKVGTWEDEGSNRGRLIDKWNAQAGVALASYYCATFASAMWEEGGAPELPPRGLRASCDEWMKWGKATGRWSQDPHTASVVLYGVPGDASHCGIVVRLHPVLCDVEGNSSIRMFSRNGEAVTFKDVALRRVLGYVNVVPLSKL